MNREDDDTTEDDDKDDDDLASSTSSRAAVDDDNQQQLQQHNQLYFHEQLGAPALVYRNVDCYTLLDETPPVYTQTLHSSDAIAQDRMRLMKLQCRWYYPVDYHLLRVLMPPLPTPKRFSPYPDPPSRRRRVNVGSISRWHGAAYRGFQYACHLDGNVDWSLIDQQCHELQQEARAHMLLLHPPLLGPDDDPDDPAVKERQRKVLDSFSGLHPLIDATEMQRFERLMRSYQALDANYVQVCHGGTCRRYLEQQKRQRQQQQEQEEGGGGETAATDDTNNDNDGDDQHKQKQDNSCTTYELSRLYDAERRDLADPAYLAPFAVQSLREAARLPDRTDYKRREPVGLFARCAGDDCAPAGENNDVDDNAGEPCYAPEQFGNCLLPVPCPCSHCRRRPDSSSSSTTSSSSSSTWHLLYPTGPLMDTVRLSRLVFPRDREEEDGEGREDGDGGDEGDNAGGGSRKRRRRLLGKQRDPVLLDVDDRVRQLVPCGTNAFVARTGLHCTIFSAVANNNDADSSESNSSSSTSCCTGVDSLRELHRLDWRNFSSNRRRYLPSLRPADVACHPKYGRDSWTDPKIAVLCQSDRKNDDDRNVIRHVQASCSQQPHRQRQDARTTEHVITNLQRISKIDYTAHHPMVLWATARPYVRSALAGNHLNRYPRTGHGYSLFSIDLRSNRAAFQWSPSHEDFVAEGHHSLSGVATDWNKDHAVWVSSVSAGRTWELDARMPCRAVTSWSLPHACDDTGATLPVTSLYGAGTLFAQPKYYDDNSKRNPEHLPMLSVGLSPGTFGIHLYQRPVVGPRFQTQSLECASCPGLAFLKNMSIAPSSVFGLPDVDKDVFTCGLAPIYVPTSRYLSNEDLNRLGYPQDSDETIESVLCTVTMTNKGDLYAHSLLESRAGYRRSRNAAGLIVGCAALPNVNNDESGTTTDATNAAGDLRCRPRDELAIKIVNEYPLPSRSVGPPAPMLAAAKMVGLPKARMNTESEEMKDDSSAPEAAMYTIRPRPATLVRRLNDEVEDGTVQLPSRLVKASASSRKDVLDSFDHGALAGKAEAAESSRSDVTAEFLEKINKCWPDQTEP